MAGVGKKGQRSGQEAGHRLDEEEAEDDEKGSQQTTSVPFAGPGQPGAVIMIGPHHPSSSEWAMWARDTSSSTRTWLSSRR